MRRTVISTILGLLLTFSVFSATLCENPFGVLTFLPWNHSWNNYMYDDNEEIDRVIKLIKELGVSIIRVDFTWNYIEPEEGKYNFERHDYIVSVCEKNGIQILGILGYSPAWAGKNWNSPPKDIDVFLKYVKTTVKRYPFIKYWEFWNEPDSSTYWSPQDDMRTYTQLLKSVYRVIKSTNPNSYVLMGGLTSDGFYAFKNILRYGGGEYFDIVNFHPFVNPKQHDWQKEIRYKLMHLKKELKKYNLNKPIWITEIGCPGRDIRDNCYWWVGKCPDEKEQAEFLRKVYSVLLEEKGVKKIFWAFFQDTPDCFKNGIDYFGLIRSDFSRKPAYYEYQKIIEEWRKNMTTQ